MPLPPELLKRLQQLVEEAEAKLSQLDEDIDKARLAGIDTAELEKRQRRLKDRVSRIKAAYL